MVGVFILAAGTTAAFAAGPCTVGSPYKFALPVIAPAKFNAGYETSLSLYANAGGRRLILRENYGFGTYSLANPAIPEPLAFKDISSYPTYQQNGDGFSLVGVVAAAPDGSRALVTYRSPHGVLVMKPQGEVFDFGGEFRPSEANSATVVMAGSKYFGFVTAGGGLMAADVSTLLSGPPAQTIGSIASQAISGAPPAYGRVRSAGRWVFYGTTAGLALLDTAGAASTGLAGVVVQPTLTPTDFGLGPGETISGYTAGLHPTSGDLILVAEGNSGLGVRSLAAIRTSNGTSFSAVGPRYVLPAPYAELFSNNSGTTVATASDLFSFHWLRTADGWKLATLSIASWGTDQTPDFVNPVSTDTGFTSVTDTVGAHSATDGRIHLYAAAQYGAFAFPIACPATPAPTPARYFPLTPCRLFDTRLADGTFGGPAMGAGASRTWTASAGACGVPADAKALSANLTVAQPGSAGELRVYPAGIPSPVSSAISFRGGATRANNTLVTLSPAGAFTVDALIPSGTVEVVLDLNGYFK